MKCNDAGIEIIKHFEGWSSNSYQDPIGIWTIGFGSIWQLDSERVTKKTPPLSKEEGELLLRRELLHVEKAVNKLVTVELTENAFSSLCSWCYNLGTSAEFPKWRMAGGKILSGLVRRRVEERKLFES